MVRPKRTILEKIQEGRGREIAVEFFKGFSSPSMVTKAIYPEACKMREGKSFVMPIIQKTLDEWKKEGFIETASIEIPIKKKRGKPYALNGKGYRLNLEPFYRYCKDKHNIEFTQEEKAFLYYMTYPSFARKLILTEYPSEDIMNAVLKFHIRHYFMPYGELYRTQKLSKNAGDILNEEEIKFLKRIKKDAEEITAMDSPKDHIGLMVKKSKEYSNYLFGRGIVPLSEEFFQKSEIYAGLLNYMIKYKENPKLVSGVDAKFKKALGILP